MDGWANLAAAVCEQAVDDYRRDYRRYLRSELVEEKKGIQKSLNKIRREMRNHLFWDVTIDNISFEQAINMVEKQEDLIWQKERPKTANLEG